MLHLAVLTKAIRSSSRLNCRSEIRSALQEHTQDLSYWQNADLSFACVAQIVHIGLDLLRHKLRCTSRLFDDTRENFSRGGDIPVWQPRSESIASDFARGISEFVAAVALELQFIPLALCAHAMQDVVQRSLQQYLDTDIDVLWMPVQAMSHNFMVGLNRDKVDALQSQWRSFASEIQYNLDKLDEPQCRVMGNRMFAVDQRESYNTELECTVEILERLRGRLQDTRISSDDASILRSRLQERIAELEDSADHCRKSLAKLNQADTSGLTLARGQDADQGRLIIQVPVDGLQPTGGEIRSSKCH